MKNLNFLIWALLLFVLSCAQPDQYGKILKEFHDPNSEYVMVAAHRAAHTIHPENSLPAIKHAIEMGVDIIELDVKVTRDGVPVLMHDRTIDRTTNASGDPESFTLKELKTFYLKNNDGTISNERIPTFEEAMELVRGKVMVDIDIKTSKLKPIADIVEKTNTLEQVFYFDNDYLALREVLSYEAKTMLMPRAYSYEMADSAIRTFQPEVIHIDPSFYSSEVSELIRNADARIWINALGDCDKKVKAGEIEALNDLLKHNANIIQTDEPEKIIRYLEQKGLRK